MTQIFFLSQIDRLKRRFGEKHFDIEFIKLVGQEVNSMSDMGLQRFVDVMIGSRTHNKPPLLSEFREARLNEEKQRLSRDGQKWVEEISRPARQKGLKKILKELYGVSSVKEAIEYERLQKGLREANETKDHGEDDREPDTRMAKNEGDLGV